MHEFCSWIMKFDLIQCWYKFCHARVLFMNHEVWSDPMLIQVLPCTSLFMNHEVWSDPMLIQIFPCTIVLWGQHSQASPSWCWENPAHWTPWTPAGAESGCYTSEITGDDVSLYLPTEDVSHKTTNLSTLLSGVGTVAAVLAATLFRPWINIHNLHATC